MMFKNEKNTNSFGAWSKSTRALLSLLLAAPLLLFTTQCGRVNHGGSPASSTDSATASDGEITGSINIEVKNPGQTNTSGGFNLKEALSSLLLLDNDVELVSSTWVIKCSGYERVVVFGRDELRGSGQKGFLSLPLGTSACENSHLDRFELLIPGMGDPVLYVRDGGQNQTSGGHQFSARTGLFSQETASYSVVSVSSSDPFPSGAVPSNFSINYELSLSSSGENIVGQIAATAATGFSGQAATGASGIFGSSEVELISVPVFLNSLLYQDASNVTIDLRCDGYFDAAGDECDGIPVGQFAVKLLVHNDSFSLSHAQLDALYAAATTVTAASVSAPNFIEDDATLARLTVQIESGSLNTNDTYILIMQRTDGAALAYKYWPVSFN